MSAFESRRNVARREVMLPCQIVREHDFVLVADRSLDISTEGMLVPLNKKVLTGESLIISFQIPGMWVDAEAIVARIVHGRRPGDDGLAAGVLFTHLSSAARAALAGYLHGRREPLPRRGPLAAVRRGAETPKLADEASMLAPLAIDAEADGIGLSILRAVASAWQSLGID